MINKKVFNLLNLLTNDFIHWGCAKRNKLIVAVLFESSVSFDFVFPQSLRNTVCKKKQISRVEAQLLQLKLYVEFFQHY